MYTHPYYSDTPNTPLSRSYTMARNRISACTTTRQSTTSLGACQRLSTRSFIFISTFNQTSSHDFYQGMTTLDPTPFQHGYWPVRHWLLRRFEFPGPLRSHHPLARLQRYYRWSALATTPKPQRNHNLDGGLYRRPVDFFSFPSSPIGLPTFETLTRTRRGSGFKPNERSCVFNHPRTLSSH